MAKQVTSRDVASAAGVSQSTVSFVLNDNPSQSISQTTRDKVHRAAQELGYTPSHAGRALRRGRSDVVLLLLSSAPLGSLGADVVNFVTDEFEKKGFAVLTRRVRPGESISALWRGLSPALVIGVSKIPDADLEELRAAGVLTYMPDSADANHRMGALQASHLADLGHRQLGYVWPSDPRQRVYAENRLGGVRAECAARELPEPFVAEVDFTPEAAVEAIRKLRSGPSPATGLCVYNDEYAFAVLTGLRLVGLRVPADVAVVGVDNIALAQFAHPPLTSVDGNLPAMLSQLAELTTDVLNGPTKKLNAAPAELTLVKREST